QESLLASCESIFRLTWHGPEAHQYLQDARCLLQSGNAGERLRVLKASLLRLTPIENLSVVQDGQALGQARFDLVLAHEHVLLVDLERTAPGQASGGTGGTAS
ncbi:phage neck terminator protein, partial [Pseudomonas aeruginosa]